jgi:integrase
MASLCHEKNGTHRVEFYGEDRKRYTVRLGKVSKLSALQTKHHIEELVSARLGRTAVPTETARWVGDVPDKLAEKLYFAGLIRQRQKRVSMTMGKFVEWFIDFKSVKNEHSIKNYRQVGRILCRQFGVNTTMDAITTEDSESFLSSLRKRYAPATVARLTKFFKQFWKVAIRAGFTTTNPFEEFVAGSCSNHDRIQFVPRDAIDRIMAACPDVEWQAIVALARFGGLRIPSELSQLRWDDVQWTQRRIVVNSSKTGRREIPLYDEILKPLKEHADESRDGDVYVFRYSRRKPGNLRTSFQRIIHRAGVKPWPRLFHNLRASCGMELADRVPPHVYGAIMGHTATVALQHYLKVRTEDFEKLVGKPSRQNAEINGSTPAQIGSSAKNAADITVIPRIAGYGSENQYTPQDTALLTNSPVNRQIEMRIAADSAADPTLARLIAAWPTLTPGQRAEIVAIVGG